MTCAWHSKLSHYTDDELSRLEAAQLEEHLRACSSCAVEALILGKAKRSVRTAASHTFTPSPEFRAKIAQTIKPQHSKWSVWLPQLAFVGALVIAVALGLSLWGRRPQQRDLVAEIIDLHTSTLASPNPVDVISTDRHTVKPWFEGKLPFTFNLPELSNSEFQLIGGRLVYVAQAPGAYLLFGAGRHRVSVLILQDQAYLTGISSVATLDRGFSLENWHTNGLRYVAISDASPQTVESLCNLIKSAQGGGLEP
jgi:anti-sigma factor RsiW